MPAPRSGRQAEGEPFSQATGKARWTIAVITAGHAQGFQPRRRRRSGFLIQGNDMFFHEVVLKSAEVDDPFAAGLALFRQPAWIGSGQEIGLHVFEAGLHDAVTG